MILVISWTILIMIIWYRTDAFTQYFSNFRKVKEWEEYRIINPDINFPEFLLLKYPSFITKVLACQLCLLFWVSLILSVGIGIINLPIVYIASFIIFRLLRFI